MKLKLYNPQPIDVIIVTQKFGENALPIYQQWGLLGHNGLDCVAGDGTPVLASHDGVVTFAGDDGSGGLGVVIRTKEQFEDINGRLSFWKTIYWHLKSGSICVHPHDEVRAGQQIGGADNTGASSGTHLHFGLKPVAQGENDWTWDNIEQNNGYRGAVDATPYMTGTQAPQIKHIFLFDIKLGDEGEEVKQLQTTLQSLGFFTYQGPKGFYGNITVKAVQDFAHSKGLLITGKKVGPQVRKLLNSG